MTIGEVSKKYGIPTDTLRYYERVGAIPPVTRNKNGIRDYSETDEAWVELAGCMRQAGLQVEFLAEYVRLNQQGDSTIPDRLKLLTEQRNILLAQQKKMDETLDRLNYKIAHYEKAVKTGELSWNNNSFRQDTKED